MLNVGDCVQRATELVELKLEQKEITARHATTRLAGFNPPRVNNRGIVKITHNILLRKHPYAGLPPAIVYSWKNASGKKAAKKTLRTRKKVAKKAPAAKRNVANRIRRR